MPLKEILVLIVILGVLIALAGIYFFFISDRFKDKKKTSQPQPTAQPPVTNINIPSLEDLIAVVDNPESKKADLTEAVEIMADHYPVPSNGNDQHLYFVYALAKHKKSDAKIIVKMDRSFKKASPKMETMIDQYEQKGLNDRR